MRIAFIGFGEAARAFHDSLVKREPGLEFIAYDVLLDREAEDGACRKAIRGRNVAVASSAAEAVADADWVISAVTADQSLEAAKAVAPSLAAGQVFIDINSVSPKRKQESAALIEKGGAQYVDMAVMAPVHPRGHATPTLLAGSIAQALSPRLEQLGFAFEVIDDAPGKATAVKMVRSLFVKGLEAITVETILAASASGCLDRVTTSLKDSYPGLDLGRLVPYHFERTLKHGRRRAAEMRESAATLNDLGLHGVLADAIADVQQAMGDLPQEGIDEAQFEQELDKIVALRRGKA